MAYLEKFEYFQTKNSNIVSIETVRTHKTTLIKTNELNESLDTKPIIHR